MPGGRLREATVLCSLALLAVLAGIAAKEADESQITWASNLGDYPAAWVLALALIGRFSPGLVQAAVRAAVFFVAMCLAYYAWARYAMEFPVDRDFYFWMILAVTAVPAISAVVRWASLRRGALAGLLIAGVGALAVVDGLAWQLWWAWVLNQAPDDFPLRPVQGIISIVVALIVTGLLPKHTTTRMYAFALLLPSAMVLEIFVDRVLSAAYGLF